MENVSRETLISNYTELKGIRQFQIPKEFYNGFRLLSTLDLDGNIPEIFGCTGNRTGGKSFFFKQFMLEQWIGNHKKKMMVLFRKKPEMIDASVAFMKDFKDVGMYTNLEISEISCNGGIFNEWFINGESCGYTTYLNASNSIKRISSYFVDVDSILMDEIQPEDMQYLDREVEKLISIHTSVARGGGKHVRYVRTFLVGNNASQVNPYYNELGIDIRRIQKDTKFLRGNGWIFEFNRNKTAQKAIKESAFNRAFSNNGYLRMSADNTALLDNSAFVCNQRPANSIQVCSLRVSNTDLAVWSNKNCIYVDRAVDLTKLRLSGDYESMRPDIPHISTSPFFHTFRLYYKQSRMMFSDIFVKNLIVDKIFNMG